MYQFFHASAEAIKELKKHHLYDEQTTQMYTGFYTEAFDIKSQDNSSIRFVKDTRLTNARCV